MLTCVLKTHVKESKSINIFSSFVYYIYYKFKNQIKPHIPTKNYITIFNLLTRVLRDSGGFTIQRV